MIYKSFLLSLAILSSSCAHSQLRKPTSEAATLPPSEFLELVSVPTLNLKLRAGYSLETSELKGCILYLQGLADSIRNHRPYFSRLNEAGYRVIYFDYMGQGGSEGSMNNTRVQAELPPHATRQMLQRHEKVDKHYEIQEQGEFFWSRYKFVKNNIGQDCSESPRLIIGWSTGGLAGYRMANEKRADAVILIAPGIHPKWMVGESANSWNKMVFLKQVITERTLTRNRFEGEVNPHLEPIKPKSPANVPRFAGNLIGIATHSTSWKIQPSIQGMVFLSGMEDTYVDREATLSTLGKNAPHFEVVSYDGALHELDNETPEVTKDLYERSIRFLNSVIAR